MQTLWRIESTAATMIRDTDAFIAGLTQHLHYCALTTVVRQQGVVQRAYLALPACAGCPSERCEPGCYVELTRRLLGVTQAARLSPVSAGLADAPYRAGALAWPTPVARELDSALIGNWESAQLLLDWKHTRCTPPFRVGALLLTDGTPPHPASLLRAYGWRGFPLPRALVAPGGDRAWRYPLPFSGAWAGAPFLLAAAAPTASAATVSETPRGYVQPERDLSVPTAPTGIVSETPQDEAQAASVAAANTPGQRLAQRLRTLLAGNAAADASTTQAAFPIQNHHVGQQSAPNGAPAQHDQGHAAIAVVEPTEESIWPAGPGRMRPADVAFLIEQLQTSPIVQGVEPGITRKRLAQLLPDDQAEYARQLMLWLHEAGALHDPNPPDAPFRNPRPLRVSEREALAARLRATPLPSAEAAKAAMQS